MFEQPLLDSQDVTLGGQPFTLFELSAWDRNQYLGYLGESDKPAPAAEDADVAARTAAGVAYQAWDVKIAARLVAYGLRHPGGVEAAHQGVLNNWSPRHIYAAHRVVAQMSGFTLPEVEGETAPGSVPADEADPADQASLDPK